VKKRGAKLANKIRRHSASAEIEMGRDGVLFVQLRGPLTAAGLLFLKAGIVEKHSSGVLAVVVDYRGAVVALDGAGLDAVLEGEADGSMPAMPAAMIVRPECIELFRGHALRMAGAHGIVRRVFTAETAAKAWASEMAARPRV